MRSLRWISVAALLAAAAAVNACAGSSGDDATATDDALAQTEDAKPLMPIDQMIARAKRRDYWPTAGQDWRSLDDGAQARLMSSPACADFASFMFPPADADARTAAALGKGVDDLKDEQQALRTDGALVVKNGAIVYERYVGPYEGHPEKRHCIWSATKSVTAGIMGAIVQSSARAAAGERAPGGRATRAGKPIDLDTPLSDLADLDGVADARVASLTVEDLLSMNFPSPAWNEGYDGNIATSDVVRMLWTGAARDMGRYAMGALLGPAAPDAKTSFRYSSGAAVTLMYALKQLYGAEYDRLPWTVLFDRLGMSSAVLERDRNGVFVGSSYAHMTLRDMARFGYAYLNGGWFAGEQVIDPRFVDAARVLGAGMRSSGTTDEAIEEEGSFYSLGFWINPNPRVLESQHVRAFGAAFPANATNGLRAGSKFFPHAPVDVFFAAGHYGQNIIIFPKDDLMIVRMSHDKEYFSKLDEMMSSARACFLGAGAEVPR